MAPPLPVTRLALERTVRLVAAAETADSVLLKLIDAAQLADLLEIERATSGRLSSQCYGSEVLPLDHLSAGFSHTPVVNAAFAYWRPGELNRFSGPGRAAWYGALDVETARGDVAFHLARELARVNCFHATVEYTELIASFAGRFVDLREVAPEPHCLHPDPAIGYPAGNTLAQQVRTEGYNGILYPSLRHRTGGTCIAALWPSVVQSVTQGAVVWRATWRGRLTPEWEVVGP